MKRQSRNRGRKALSTGQAESLHWEIMGKTGSTARFFCIPAAGCAQGRAKLWPEQSCHKNFWEIMGNAAVFACELDIAVTLA